MSEMGVSEMCDALSAKPTGEAVLAEARGSVASAIVDTIRELDRHIEANGWSSNTEAKRERQCLVHALIDMGNPLKNKAQRRRDREASSATET